METDEEDDHEGVQQQQQQQHVCLNFCFTGVGLHVTFEHVGSLLNNFFFPVDGNQRRRPRGSRGGG